MFGPNNTYMSVRESNLASTLFGNAKIYNHTRENYTKNNKKPPVNDPPGSFPTLKTQSQRGLTACTCVRVFECVLKMGEHRCWCLEMRCEGERAWWVYDRFFLLSKFLKLAGLIFISANWIECSWPFQWNQLIPCGKNNNNPPPNNTNHQLFLNCTSSSEQGASFTGKNLIFSLDNSTAYGSCYGLPLHFLRCVWKRSYLTVTFVAIFPHEVDTVTVFIPKGAFVGQGAVGHSDIVIIVVSGEGPTLVVGHGVTWWTNEYYSVKAVWWKVTFLRNNLTF